MFLAFTSCLACRIELLGGLDKSIQWCSLNKKGVQNNKHLKARIKRGTLQKFPVIVTGAVKSYFEATVQSWIDSTAVILGLG
jgi:hypothetical protein